MPTPLERIQEELDRRWEETQRELDIRLNQGLYHGINGASGNIAVHPSGTNYATASSGVPMYIAPPSCITVSGAFDHRIYGEWKEKRKEKEVEDEVITELPLPTLGGVQIGRNRLSRCREDSNGEGN